MKRKIIRIDEDKCNGCGNCVTACAEGALQLVDGKARLIKEQFCDGFGDCIGECPTGALIIEERESEAFDMDATREHVRAEGGEAAVSRMDTAGAGHEETPKAKSAAGPPRACPGSLMRSAPRQSAPEHRTPAAGGPAHVLQSDLEQWPVQLHLLQAGAPFLRDRELVVLSTCSPVASADVHWRFIRGRAVAVGCPKLDRTEPYAEKLGAILAEPTIPKVIVVRMEVPCCGGLTAIVREAVGLSGRKDLRMEEVTVGVNGDILQTQELQPRSP